MSIRVFHQDRPNAIAWLLRGREVLQELLLHPASCFRFQPRVIGGRRYPEPREIGANRFDHTACPTVDQDGARLRSNQAADRTHLR